MRLLALALVLTLQQQDPDKAVRELIEKFRSGDVVVREEATRKLKELGKSAKPELEKAAKDRDGQVARLASSLVERLSLQETLSPRLQEELPGLPDKLAFGGDTEWTQAFLAVAWKREVTARLAFFTRKELEPLAIRAVRGAATADERESVCMGLDARRIRTADLEVARLFEDPDEDVRWAAWDALPRNPPKEVLQKVRDLIRHEDPGVRAFAVSIASNFRMEDTAPDIIKALEDADKDVRARAVRTLADLRGKAAVKDLVPLLKDKSAEVRSQTLETLSRVLHAREAAVPMAALLTDPDEEVRVDAIRWLGNLGVPESTTRIAPLLENEDKEVRFWAIRALESLGARGQVTGVIKRLSDEDEDVRRAALWFLGAVAPKEAREESLKLVKHSNTDTRAWAIATLGAVRARDAIPVIREGLKDKEPEVRAKAAESLGTLRAIEAATELMKVAGEGAEDERMRAILALARLESKEAVPVIVKCLKHESDRVRTVAVGALVVLKAKDFLKDIAELLKDPDASVRAQSVRALAALQGRESIPRIVQCLTDPNAGQVCTDTMWALSDLEAWDLAPRVEPLLEDYEWKVRLTAAAFLAQAGSTSGVQLLLDEDPFNYLTFLNALRRPDLWKRLRAIPAPSTQGGTVLEEIERAAKAAGLKVEVEPAPLDDAARWLGAKYDGRDPEEASSVGQRLTRTVPFYTYLPVFEADRVRVLPREAGVRFWREWWKDYQATKK